MKIKEYPDSKMRVTTEYELLQFLLLPVLQEGSLC